jgi:hypothetical protein
MDEISVVTTPKDNHTNDFIGATEVLANNEQRLRECTSVAVTVDGSGKFHFLAFIFKKVTKGLERIAAKLPPGPINHVTH